MDPISLALGIGGLAASLFGGFMSSRVSKEEAGVSADIAQLEGQENQVRRDAMNASANRADLETLRTGQRARAAAVQAGVTQTGSLTGSGVQGGIAETTNETAYGIGGIEQQRAFGNRMFNLDALISQDRVRLAQLGGQASTYQGVTSLGGSLLTAGPKIGAAFGFGASKA